MRTRLRSPLFMIAIGICLNACSSGPFKWNQAQPASVQDNPLLPKARQSSFTVLIIPNGATNVNYISDKTSTAGGVLGSMVIGPMAGAIGGLVGSTAGSTAAASAEESASKHIDSSDIARALEPAQLPTYFASVLAEKLNQCGIRTAIYPLTLNTGKTDWTKSHLVLPAGFVQESAAYRFFVETGVTGIQLRAGLKDTTMEGDAYARVYETRSLRQMGRYVYKTGSSGSVTLNAYGRNDNAKTAELQKSAHQVSQYLAGGIANDMCAIMARF